MQIRRSLKWFLVAFAALIFLPQDADAQYGTKFIWTDSLTVTTAGVDSFFTNQWEEVTFWCRSADGEYKASTRSDTTSWSSRDFVRIVEHQQVYFGPATKLGRLEFKANSGTVTLYMTGTKTVSRYP